MNAMSLIKISLACLGFLYGGPPVWAATIAVTTTTDEFDSGTGCSLREALEAANSNSAFGGCNAGEAVPTVDSVSVGPGNYLLSIPAGSLGNQSGDLDTTESVIIRGNPANPASTLIDATAVNDGVFETGSEPGGTVTLSGLTLTGGKSAFGGGIHNGAELLIVEFSIIRDNTATFGGGGIANISAESNLILRNSLVLSNHAIDSGKDRGFGGGLVVENSWAKVLNTTFSKNTADQNGGGIRNTSGPLTLVNVTLTQNTADADKGAPSGGAAGSGGGIYAPFDMPLEVKNSIIAFNHAGAVADTQNCNFAEQTNPSSGYNVENANTCKFTATGDLADSENLLLSPAVSDNGGPTPTHSISSGSDAVDRVADGSCKNLDGATLTADQRGSARPINADAVAGALCDSGAFELEACGDGIISAKEACDPGSDLASDCCAADCQFLPEDSACDDGKAETSEDLCDAAGSCAGSTATPPVPPIPPLPEASPEATSQTLPSEENTGVGGAGVVGVIAGANQLSGSGCSLRVGSSQGPTHFTVPATLLGLLVGAGSFARKK